MIHVNELPLDFEPRRKILPKLPVHPHEPEMSEFESAFLCGALKTFRPKKILEVGVAGGATTAIILQALENLGEPYEIHSVDLNQKFYRDPSKDTAFMATFAKEKIFGELRGTHEFHLGKFLPQVIDKISGEIDFVILDTVHSLPGEGLDFLAVLPYLKNGAGVVLHDVALNQYGNSPNGHATTILFSAVTAEKFLNFVLGDVNNKFAYPNIAAFRINEQTSTNIENIFLSLIIRWAYLPSQGEINIYRAHYQRYYPQGLCNIYNEAVKMNLYNMVMASYG